MTQDEIIKMALQAGFVEYELDDGTTSAFDKRYEAFAELIAAHILMNIDPSKFISWQEGFEAGVAKEREACANINFRMNLGLSGDQCYGVSELIRARGEA